MFPAGLHSRSWSENARLWSRYLIITSVLAGSAYLAPRGALGELTMPLPRVAQLAALAMAAAAALLVFLRCPPLGIAALAGGILTVPLAIGTGTGTNLNIATLLVGCLVALWVLEMAARRRAELAASLPVIPLLAFVAVAVLAFFAGMQPWLHYVQVAPLPAQAGGLAIVLLSAAAFLLVGHQVRDLRWLQAITWLFLALAALHIAGRFVPAAGELSGLFLGGTVLGSVFWIWVAVLAFSQAAFNRNLSPIWRLALGALLLATLYVGLVPQRHWTSGWLPALVAIAVALWAGAPRVTPFLVLAGLAAAVARAPKVYELVMSGDNEYSLTTRLEAWRTLGEIVSANPILGLGFANYYWYTPYFPILGVDALGTTTAYAVRFNSHNNYVDILAQTGLVGLACFLWFACAVGVLAWRLRTRAAPGFARAYVYGALGGLAGMVAAGMLGDWVLPFVYNIGFAGFRYSVLGWIFLGGLLVVERATRENKPAEGEADGVRG